MHARTIPLAALVLTTYSAGRVAANDWRDLVWPAPPPGSLALSLEDTAHSLLHNCGNCAEACCRERSPGVRVELPLWIADLRRPFWAPDLSEVRCRRPEAEEFRAMSPLFRAMPRL